MLFPGFSRSFPLYQSKSQRNHSELPKNCSKATHQTGCAVILDSKNLQLYDRGVIGEEKMKKITKKIEWNVNMDSMLFELSSIGGQKIDGQKPIKTPGRCKSCWGGLVGRRNKENEFTGIKCRVCGTKLEGKDAADEEKRMEKEMTINLMNMMQFGHYPKYGEGLFVQKVFPYMERQTEAEIGQRISTKVAEGNKQGKLTRNSFPAGSAGFLYLQAKILIAGIADIVNLHDRFATERDVYRFQKNGSVLVSDNTLAKIGEDAGSSEYRMMKKMGCYMSSAMLAAFSCELTMKAISLICKNEALKDHDLLNLYYDLPEECQQRISADFKEMENVMKDGRQAFGKWRYFERNIGEEGIRGLIDWERTLRMAKAARVLLDEAEMVGLSGDIKHNLNEKTTVTPKTRSYQQKVKLTIKGREAPPKNL